MTSTNSTPADMPEPPPSAPVLPSEPAHSGERVLAAELRLAELSLSTEPAPPVDVPPVTEPALTGDSTQVAPAGAGAELSPKACGALLAERFPALFGGPAKPLKLRIQTDIQARAPGLFSKQTLSAFFRRHTGSNAYLSAMARGKQRFDLDGVPSGELAEEHRKAAADELTRRRTSQDARRAEEEAGLRQRANLLRDFETTTLTQANFCGLKGITPAELEAQLVQARREAAALKLQPPAAGRAPPSARPANGRPPDARPDGARRDGARPDGARPDGARPGGPRPPQHRRKPTGPRS